MRSLILMAVAVGLTVAQNPSTLCADQKSFPLLVGKGDIYPCVHECPDGFTCEKESEDDVGVCCPNLRQLTELYGEHNDSGTLDFEKNVQQKTVEEKDVKEIRRSPGRAERVFFEQSLQPSPQVVPPSAQPLPIPQPKSGFVCDRQKFKTTCEVKGFVKSTQFVVRWYVQNGKCHSYPYGFCPGTRVEQDPTLRTKDDCELLCLTPEEFRHSDLFDFLATAEASVTQPPEFESFDELPGNDVGVELDVATQLVEKSDGEQALQKFKNPDVCGHILPFKAMCKKTMRPSHYTLRWVVVNGKCESYPYGYCPEEYDPEVLILSTKDQCEAFCSHQLII